VTALEFKKNNPGISDDDLIKFGFLNPDLKKWVWSEESINNNILWLIMGYCIIVILFVALISLISEILTFQYTKSNKKFYNDNEVKQTRQPL
jgi:hypothetical protein